MSSLKVMYKNHETQLTQGFISTIRKDIIFIYKYINKNVISKKWNYELFLICSMF